MSNFGYWVKLSDVETTKDFFKVLPVGTYQHPKYGELSFTNERINRFADNINQRVRGIDIDVDYDHKNDVSKGSKAAGWIRQAKAVDDQGLFVQIDFTESANGEIQDGEWRYFSPEFVDEWTDTHGKAYQDVLMGAALTNRPFLKDLKPINFSEVYEEHYKNTNQLTNTTSTTTGIKTFLAEVVSEEDVSSKENEGNVEDLLKKLSEILGSELDDADAAITAVKRLKSSATEESSTDSEESVAKFEEQFPEQAKILREQQVRLAEDNAERVVSKLVRNEKGIGIPPAVLSDATSLCVKLGEHELTDEFSDFMGKLIEAGGTVNFNEQGSETGTTSEAEDDPRDDFIVKFNEIRDKNPELSHREAHILTEQTFPELTLQASHAQVS